MHEMTAVYAASKHIIMTPPRIDKQIITTSNSVQILKYFSLLSFFCSRYLAKFLVFCEVWTIVVVILTLKRQKTTKDMQAINIWISFGVLSSIYECSTSYLRSMLSNFDRPK